MTETIEQQETELVKKYVTKLIPMADIYEDTEFNVRGVIAPFDVKDLAQDIRERGLMSPIVLVPDDKVPGKKFKIIAGHRRWHAHKWLNVEKIPAMIRMDLIGDEVSQRFFNLAENHQRTDPDLMMEAFGIRKLLILGVSEGVIAKKLKVSPTWVTVRRKALEQPPEIQKCISKGLFTQEQLKWVYALTTDEDKFAYARKVGDAATNAASTRQVIPDKKTMAQRVAKKARGRGEINQILDAIYDSLGPSFTTRVIGWIIGINSDIDVHTDIWEYAILRGKRYNPPADIAKEVLEKHQGRVATGECLTEKDI